MNTGNLITSILNAGNNNYESLVKLYFCHLVVGVKLTAVLYLACITLGKWLHTLQPYCIKYFSLAEPNLDYYCTSF